MHIQPYPMAKGMAEGMATGKGPDARALEQAAKQLGKGGGLPGLGGGAALPPGLSGLGKKK